MKQGDVSRRRRFGPGARWYAAYRTARFSRRMTQGERDVYQAAAATMGRIRRQTA
jgi:hypothetical protein